MCKSVMSDITPEATAVLEKVDRCVKDADGLSDYWQDWGQRKIDFILDVAATIREKGFVSERQKEVLNDIHIEIGEKLE